MKPVSFKERETTELKFDPGPIEESVSSTQVFVRVFFTVEDYEWYDIFGSGTKLLVTDEEVVKPMVSVYPAARRDHREEKSILLCVASAMVPPLVQISWKRQKNHGPLEEVLPAEGEQLEVRESGRTSSILLVNHGLYPYKYRCSVKHEGGTVEALTGIEVPADPFWSECRVRLLTLLYSVLIVKSLVYCCGLCLLRSNTLSIL